LKVATHEDFDVIHKMAMNFLNSSPYKDLGNEDTIAVLIADILNSPQNERIIIFSEAGFIVGAAMPFLFGPHMLASEVAWWVEPDHRGNGEGLNLLSAFEYWAKNIANCKLISMSSLDKEVEKYYKKNGYKLYERAYMKVI